MQSYGPRPALAARGFNVCAKNIRDSI
ncbi:hypothetical protein BLAT2472_120012 [Burkholderia latens]